MFNDLTCIICLFSDLGCLLMYKCLLIVWMCFGLEFEAKCFLLYFATLAITSWYPHGVPMLQFPWVQIFAPSRLFNHLCIGGNSWIILSFMLCQGEYGLASLSQHLSVWQEFPYRQGGGRHICWSFLWWRPIHGFHTHCGVRHEIWWRAPIYKTFIYASTYFMLQDHRFILI